MKTNRFLCSLHVLFNGGVFKAAQFRKGYWKSYKAGSIRALSLPGSYTGLHFAVAKGAACPLSSRPWNSYPWRNRTLYYVGIETSGPAVPGIASFKCPVCSAFGMRKEGNQVPSDEIVGGR